MQSRGGGTDRSPIALPGYTGWRVAGRGGFGVVYRARHTALGRQVAVKILPIPEDERTARRFERECQAAGRVAHHPNIVSVFDAGVAQDGQPYIVMEYLGGGSLADRVNRDGRLDPEAAVGIGVELAGALHSAHEAGVLHRDVKPQNILFGDDGRPHLADFGIAQIQASTTQTTSVSATLAYAAPEQLGDGSQSTARSDVYSLGASMIFAVSGQPPFTPQEGESLVSTIARIVAVPPPDPAALGFSENVAAVLRSALSKTPEGRPTDAMAFALALRDAGRRDGLGMPEPILIAPRIEGDAMGGDETIVRRTRPEPGKPGPAPIPWVPIAAGIGGLVLLAALISSMSGGSDPVGADTTTTTSTTTQPATTTSQTAPTETTLALVEIDPDRMFGLDAAPIAALASGDPWVTEVANVTVAEQTRSGDVWPEDLFPEHGFDEVRSGFQRGITASFDDGMGVLASGTKVYGDEVGAIAGFEVLSAALRDPVWLSRIAGLADGILDSEVEDMTGPRIGRRDETIHLVGPGGEAVAYLWRVGNLVMYVVAGSTQGDAEERLSAAFEVAKAITNRAAEVPAPDFAPPLPDFVGQHRDEAYAWLEENGLVTIQHLLRYDDDPGVPDAHVIEQRIAPGTLVPLGFRVALITKGNDWCDAGHPEDCSW